MCINLIDISVSALEKFFGDFQLLKNITFELYEGDKVGLIGKNGAGKTTLMKILIGAAGTADGAPVYSYDKGGITIASGRRVGLIDQLPVYPQEYSVDQVLKTAFARLDAMRTELTRLEQQMEDDHSPALLKRYGELASLFEHDGGYDSGYMLEKVAHGLGLDADMRSRPFSLLSGGEQTRVNLARVILEKTDILLLDEPTNHLDIDAVEWLGEYLSAYRGTVLVISHDRYFLDQVAERIIEIENGVSVEYDGNYSYYAVEKQRRFDESMDRWESAEKEKQRLEEIARRFRSWATEKMLKRALTVEHRIEKLSVGDRPRRERRMAGKLSEVEFYADEALKLRGLTKSFDERRIINDLNLIVAGGERVAIYGPNGCGKTTLLRLITGELTPDAGIARFGPQIKWAYLPQIVKFDNMERSVLDTILYTLPLSTQAARTRLGTFRFSGEDVYKPLSALSGGERSRLKLCILMLDDLNMLILDEPTNHLDLASREWIEEVLEEFGGVILFVSHDRYFVARFASRIWKLSNGTVEDYLCGFEEYRTREKRLAEQNIKTKKATAAAHEEKIDSDLEKNTAESKAKQKKPRPGSSLKQKEACLREISSLERELEELERELTENQSNYLALPDLLEKKEGLEEELLFRYSELEELEKAGV